MQQFKPEMQVSADIISKLISLGAQPHQSSKDGLNPLVVGIMSEQGVGVDFLLQYKLVKNVEQIWD